MRSSQGKDRMIIDLGHGIAYTIALKMRAFCTYDCLIDIGMHLLQPCRQSGTEIKTDILKIPCFRIRSITFCGNFFIIVCKRSSTGFKGKNPRKWLYAGWLIKVTMEAKVIEIGERRCK